HACLLSFPTRRSSDLDAAEKIVGTAPLVLSKMANPATLERILHSLSARKAVFETASPEAPFLMETRSTFIDPGQWLSSADFMDQDRKSTRLNSSHVKN